MLCELISEFAKWLSEADDIEINKRKIYLSYNDLLITVLLGDEVKIKEIFDIDLENIGAINPNKLDMNVDLFLEITTKLLKNKKEELQTL